MCVVLVRRSGVGFESRRGARGPCPTLFLLLIFIIKEINFNFINFNSN
jgi:hypothetical protein